MDAIRGWLAATIAAAIVLIAASAVRADPITDQLSLGTGLSLNWTSSADSLTIPVTNSAPSGNPVLASWDLTLELVPAPGNLSGGTLLFDNANIALPANSALTHNAALLASPGNTATQVFIQALNNSFNPLDNDVVPSSGKNLASLKFISSGASGDYILRAIDNRNQTDWFANDATRQGYGNAANGASFDLGTIHVLAAVPEPASLMLGAISGLGLAGYSWRRKRRGASPDRVAS